MTSHRLLFFPLFLVFSMLSLSVGACGSGSTGTSDLYAATEPAGDVSGKWAGRWTSRTTVSGAFEVTMRQTGTSLDGDLHFSGSPCFSGGRFAGTVSGSNFSGTVTAGGIRVDMSGTVTGNTYDGTYSAVSAGACTGDTGTFTANR